MGNSFALACIGRLTALASIGDHLESSSDLDGEAMLIELLFEVDEFQIVAE